MQGPCLAFVIISSASCRTSLALASVVSDLLVPQQVGGQVPVQGQPVVGRPAQLSAGNSMSHLASSSQYQPYSSSSTPASTSSSSSSSASSASIVLVFGHRPRPSSGTTRRRQ